ncbi:MAG: DVUA0089 family protein [Betaproteobacteria bacterium]|nr:DVUA0089 family protein [Betaproteobacteria bacterium]MCL2886657.1 DVUA0089 family protein [Betaproteobacteria bacterium]
MKKILAAIVAFVALTGLAQAVPVNATGAIETQHDIGWVDFELTQDVTDFSLWSDSWTGTTNFNPIVALWDAATGAFIGRNNGQDSTFAWSALNTGSYVITITAFNYNPSGNSNLNDADPFGFKKGNGDYKEETMPIELWSQPGPGTGTGNTGFWSIWYDFTPVSNNVPEPGTLALAALGLIGLAMRRRKTA